MRRRGNIWVWLIGIPIILGAIAHWGFYFFIKSKLDDSILRASPHAAISYQNLATSLSGKIDVNGIDLVPVGMKQGIFIRAIHVSGPDAFAYLMQQIMAMGKVGPPASLKVVVKGIQLDISAEMAAKLDRFSSSDLGNITMNEKSRDVCMLSGGVSFTQLNDLGFERLQGDMSFGYQYIVSGKKFYSDFDLNLDSMLHVTMTLTLNNVPALDAQKLMGVALSHLKITYDYSPEFGRKVTEYCAQKRGLTPEQYKLLLADEIVKELETKGIILGFGLKQALRSFLTNWGTLLIEISPPRPIGMFGLMRLPREQIVEKLGLQLAINDQLVTDLSFRILESVSLLRQNEAAKKKKPASHKIAEYAWEYKKIPVSSLSRYLEHKVIIKEHDGRTHEGILIEAKNGRISIQKRISGGKFTAHLLRSNVLSAQVWVRVKIEPPKKSASQQADSQKPDAGDAQSTTEQR